MNDLLSKLSKISGYQPRMQRVKDHNGNFLAWIEDDALKMTSYGHWCFLKMIDGVYVFNDYSYSNTTSRHQSTGRSILCNLGIQYVEYNTRQSLGYVGLSEILDTKIQSLYAGENDLSLSRATRYAVYSESQFNETMREIKIIQTAMKMTDKDLNEMILKAETMATEALLNAHLDESIRRESRKEATKSIQSLAPISL